MTPVCRGGGRGRGRGRGERRGRGQEGEVMIMMTMITMSEDRVLAYLVGGIEDTCGRRGRGRSGLRTGDTWACVGESNSRDSRGGQPCQVLGKDGVPPPPSLPPSSPIHCPAPTPPPSILLPRPTTTETTNGGCFGPAGGARGRAEGGRRAGGFVSQEMWRAIRIRFQQPITQIKRLVFSPNSVLLMGFLPVFREGVALPPNLIG